MIAAQQRATELRRIIDNTKVLDGLIDDRYYWAPLLALISHCVAPNIQLTSFDGSTVDTDHTISVTLEGIAAAREPRAAAEEFRQLLNEQLEKNYGDRERKFQESRGSRHPREPLGNADCERPFHSQLELRSEAG